MRWLALILVISLCAGMVVFSGCGSEKEDLIPPEITNAYEWGEFAIGGKTAELYADLESPIVSYTNLIVYFPNGTPSNPDNINTDLTLYLHLDEFEVEEIEGSVFESLPEYFILGGPSSGSAIFNNTGYFYTASVAPYIEGDWSFEFVWSSPDVNVRSYMPIEVETNPSFRAVLPAGSWKQMIVLAWLEPKVFRPGSQPYRLLSWRSVGGSQDFTVDSTLTIELTVTSETSETDTSIAEFKGGAFVGDITLPDFESWKIQARTFDDTVLVGLGVFNFVPSEYKGE